MARLAPARAELLTLRPFAGPAGIVARAAARLTLIGRGLSNAEIAVHLQLSLATVKTHVGRILAKLDARDRAQLVIVAYETGLVAVGK